MGHVNLQKGKISRVGFWFLSFSCQKITYPSKNPKLKPMFFCKLGVPMIQKTLTTFDYQKSLAVKINPTKNGPSSLGPHSFACHRRSSNSHPSRCFSTTHHWVHVTDWSTNKCCKTVPFQNFPVFFWNPYHGLTANDDSRWMIPQFSVHLRMKEICWHTLDRPRLAVNIKMLTWWRACCESRLVLLFTPTAGSGWVSPTHSDFPDLLIIAILLMMFCT